MNDVPENLTLFALAPDTSAECRRNKTLMHLADNPDFGHVYAMGPIIVAAGSHGLATFDALYHDRIIAMADLLVSY